jgi:Tol biopolymer transport system component
MPSGVRSSDDPRFRWSLEAEGSKSARRAVLKDADMRRANCLVVALLSVEFGLLSAANGSASSTTMSPGPRIAYSGQLEGKRGLVVMDGDGRFRRTITRGKALHPAWSPDGRRIAFARGGDIWIVAAGGRRDRRLTRTRANDMLPAWSPDGQWIAFVRVTRRSGGDWKTVIIVSPDGRKLRRLAQAVERNDLPWGHPTWSPDGRWIAFHTGIHQGAGALRLAHVSGRRERVLTDAWGRCGGQRISDSQPSWSPDGQWIAFLRDERAICVVRPDGSGLRRLTPDGQYYAFAWSPDGRRIAYVTSAGLCVMNASDGTASKLLTMGSNPAWSPDGRRLAFLRANFMSSADDLFMIGIDGNGERLLVRSVAFDLPAWSPR